MTYLFATNNPNKTRELKEMFQEAGLDLLTLSDLGLALSPEETGKTFEKNSLIKATETAAFLRSHGHMDLAVIADDSGLEIDAMDGNPGVDSALFLGADTSYEIRNTHILKFLANAPESKRTARFVCVITCVLPSDEILTTRAECPGLISHEIKGENGFGYDPIMYLPNYGKTMAEMPQEEKNKISHRGQALKAMLKKLKAL